MKGISKYAHLGLGIAAGALALASLVGPASADEPAPKADTDRTIASTLTTAERAQVNAEVADKLRKAPGGERISFNQIVWPEKGAVLTLALPGEKRARAADQAVGTRDEGCSYKHVCLYQYGGFEGDEIEFYECKFQKLRWYDWTNRTSSWVNNQSDYEKSTLYYWTGSKVATLDELWAPSYDEYLSGSKDNRADFVRVC